MVTYPFEPKSNAYLEAGQYWAVPLSNGRFACGRVLAVPREPDPFYAVNSRMFLAGLLRWVGDQPPDSDSIARARLLSQGFAHVLTIRENGGSVLGRRSLESDGLVPDHWRSHEGGGTVWVYEGSRRLRPATADDSSLPLISTWGFKVISRIAERVLVEGVELPRSGWARVGPGT
jgi:hypothetical protein